MVNKRAYMHRQMLTWSAADDKPYCEVTPNRQGQLQFASSFTTERRLLCCSCTHRCDRDCDAGRPHQSRSLRSSAVLIAESSFRTLRLRAFRQFCSRQLISSASFACDCVCLGNISILQLHTVSTVVQYIYATAE